MQLHPDVFDLPHDLVDKVVVELFLGFLAFGEIDPDDQLLKDIVVEVMLVGCLFPLLEHFLELEVHTKCFGVDLMQRR